MDFHTDRHCAKDGVEVYTKEQLLAVLQEIRPDALAKFPPPDSFEIREHHPGEYSFQVGSTTGYALSGYTMPGHTIPGYIPTGSYEHIGKLLWLDERKQDQARGRHMGLYYTTTDDTPCNDHVANKGLFKGTHAFGKLTYYGAHAPFCRTIKTLLRFVLVYCDRAAEYRTLEKKGKKEIGLAPLVRILQEIAKNSTTTEDSPGMKAATGTPNNCKEKKKMGVIEEALYQQRNRKPVAVRLTADDGSLS